MNNVFPEPIAILAVIPRVPASVGLNSIGMVANVYFLRPNSKHGKAKASFLKLTFAGRFDQGNPVAVSAIKKVDSPTNSVDSLDLSSVQLSTRSDVLWKGGMKALGCSALSSGKTILSARATAEHIYEMTMPVAGRTFSNGSSLGFLAKFFRFVNRHLHWWMDRLRDIAFK